MTTWILGSVFLVFIACFLLYAWTREVSASPRHHPAGDTEGNAREQWNAWDYRIEVSARAYVNYPFGLRIVFANAAARAQATSTAHDEPKPWSSGYYGWPAAEEDSELIVQGGHLELETNGVDPRLRVSLQFPQDSFEARETTAVRTLDRETETVFAFSLNPLKEASAAPLSVVFSQVPEQGDAGADRSVGPGLEAVPLQVQVTEFPIRLR